MSLFDEEFEKEYKAFLAKVPLFRNHETGYIQIKDDNFKVACFGFYQIGQTKVLKDDIKRMTKKA